MTCFSCQQLTNEVTYLKSLLSSHGIAWEQLPQSVSDRIEEQATEPRTSIQLTSEQKIALFRRLFRGRIDVYPIRWESSTGKSGYTPACGNEWKPGICNKPRIKCADCKNRLLLPVTDQIIFDHLSGKHTVGIYPILADDTCYFLAVDFDEECWKEDVLSVMKSCRELDVPACLEISRSGNGAHIWIFFEKSIPARDARLLGAALISHACSSKRQLSLRSYDRLFPNQDTLPTGGFGNLIALPLQKQPRGKDCSVFVDDEFLPWPDQWAFLASIQMMTASQLESALLRTTGRGNPLDVSYVADENAKEPWKPEVKKISGPFPEAIELVMAGQIFIAKSGLSQQLINRLIRLAAFQNPEFYKAQAMRLPVWNKPRIIGCAENYSQYIGLPRGCLDALLALLTECEIKTIIRDERILGSRIKLKFNGILRQNQRKAIKEMLQHETGVLSAPTAFGKTVVAASLVAKRKTSTLILVHRVELLKQWQEKLQTFLDIPGNNIGVIYGSKKRIFGEVDIALIQSLARLENLEEFLGSYGQVIVDECHHLSAFSFESVLKRVKAKYVTGLTATPIRRDGHHPIIFMQCGQIRYTVTENLTASSKMDVLCSSMNSSYFPPDADIQKIFNLVVNNAERNGKITSDVIRAFNEGRKILVLTGRTEHLFQLNDLLSSRIDPVFLLHGKLPAKERANIFSRLSGMDALSPRVILSTGSLIGEGFDHPVLDTLVLAMPVSWKGTLQQYAGRLHRVHAEKQDIRIYDYVEQEQRQLARMWKKRQQGYRAMGYMINNSISSL